jgi:hypothetical protein
VVPRVTEWLDTAECIVLDSLEASPLSMAAPSDSDVDAAAATIR